MFAVFLNHLRCDQYKPQTLQPLTGLKEMYVYVVLEW